MHTPSLRWFTCSAERPLSGHQSGLQSIFVGHDSNRDSSPFVTIGIVTHKRRLDALFVAYRVISKLREEGIHRRG
jgi:hypothetical protein